MAKSGISKGRVTVTVELDADGTWGFECKLDQIHKQATEEVLASLKTKLKEKNIRIVGEPKVLAILTETL